MGLMTRIADKTGALGSVVSAMGCAACFPALASFGAAIGLATFEIEQQLLEQFLRNT
ncbi:MerC family mercury resistance protein, partial [Shigella boydii]|uniref:MerC family mercury resistance protein n=1 Tax=Shigella boydii TaxID=621 RepID=UPI000AD57B85